MKNLNFTLYILLTVALISCESVIEDFELNQNDLQINLISFAEADSVPLLFLSRSIAIDEVVEYYTLSETDVSLYANNVFLGKLEAYEDNFYSNPEIVFTEETSYRIEASAAGLNSVVSEFEIPAKPIINSVEVAYKENIVLDVDHYAEDYVVVEINFENPTNELRYYEIESLGKQVITTNDTLTENNLSAPPILITNTSYIDLYNSNSYHYTEATPNETIHSSALYFDNKGLNIGENTITLYFYTYHFEYETSGSSSRIWFSFNATDHNFFEYINSLSRFQESEDDFFVEPISLYDNIDGGLGLAYGRIRNKFFVDIVNFTNE